tara:strand:- start:413 stop:655 length:243 start_codon:yes stop_codon:yes gene_type:complete
MTENRPKKRSLTLNGHKTSVSLEEPFWLFFVNIAKKQNKAVNKLASEIDINRDYKVGLASSIRVFCLKEAINKISEKSTS